MAKSKPHAPDAGPSARDVLRQRHHELIRACLRAEAGVIAYEDVKALYLVWYSDADVRNEAARHDHFRNDCRTLVRNFGEMAESYLSPFFLPTPEITYDETAERLSVSSGRRPLAVAKNKHRDQIPDRRALARFVGRATWPDGTEAVAGQPLFPRGGRVYAGHGSTVCIFFHELLCESREKLPDLTVYTASFEVAGLLYYLHQNAGTEKGGIRFGENLRVDRKMGAIVPYPVKELGQIDTAVISCNGVYGGQLFSDADVRTHEFAKPYLEKADRIIIIVEKWKVGRTDGDEFEIPDLGGKPIVLVTDAEEALVRQHLPTGVTPLFAPREPSPAG